MHDGPKQSPLGSGWAANTWHWPPLKRWRRRLRTWSNERYWTRPAAVVPRPTSARIVVTLTTSPKRLLGLEPVLTSLHNQSVQPDEIHLNIPHIFGRTREPYTIPTWIQQFAPRTIVYRMDDIGPATKNVPTFERFGVEDDVIIVTVDDDVRYLPRTIEVLTTAVAGDPSRAFALSGYDLDERGRNIYRTRTGSVQVLEGWAGWAIHRRAMATGIAGYFSACAPSRACFLHDDLVMSNWLALQRVDRVRLFDPRANTRIMKRRGAQLASGYESDALHQGAGGLASGLDPLGVRQALIQLGQWRVAETGTS